MKLLEVLKSFNSVRGILRALKKVLISLLLDNLFQKRSLLILIK
jgi:hypothetical protein